MRVQVEADQQLCPLWNWVTTTNSAVLLSQNRNLASFLSQLLAHRL